MDGEVYDDVGSSPFSLYNDVIVSIRMFLFRYGWYVLAGVLMIYQIFARFIRPRLMRNEQYRDTGIAKNNDDVSDRYADNVRAARERQQTHHDKVAAEAEVERRRKEEDKLARLRDELARKSVVDNALLNNKMGDLRRKKEKNEKAEGDPVESSAAFLLRMISSAPIVIVSKSFCPYSRKAKAAFATYRLPREEVVYLELDELGEAREKAVQDELTRLYDRERVPAIFVAGDFIGDADTIVAHQRGGILDVIVRDAIESWRKKQ